MILKWLALFLFAYVITAFVVGPDWRVVLRDTFIPSWPKGHNAWQNLVAILGTTISPYLFFWQASQEVEEEKAMGRRMLPQRQGATKREIVDRRLDVGIGTFFSNLVMYFIILTTALALHAHGVKDVETSKQAAEALRPLAGSLAYILYSVGLIGVGLLAIPTLSGSAAYALAETFKWKQGLDKRSRRPLFLRRSHSLNCAGDGDGFCRNQSGQGAFLDRRDQWCARAVFARRNLDCGIESQANEKSAEPVAVANRCRHHHHPDVRRGGRHVSPIAMLSLFRGFQ